MQTGQDSGNSPIGPVGMCGAHHASKSGYARHSKDARLLLTDPALDAQLQTLVVQPYELRDAREEGAEHCGIIVLTALLG
eukprot:11121618-Alexandrium_andersonii.AAC.1